MPRSQSTINNGLDTSSKIKKEKAWRINVIIFIVLITFIILGIILFTEVYTPPVKLENVFIDMNGDGKLDFVKSAKVILNTGSELNFP